MEEKKLPLIPALGEFYGWLALKYWEGATSDVRESASRHLERLTPGLWRKLREHLEQIGATEALELTTTKPTSTSEYIIQIDMMADYLHKHPKCDGVFSCDESELKKMLDDRMAAPEEYDLLKVLSKYGAGSYALWGMARRACNVTGKPEPKEPGMFELRRNERIAETLEKILP